MIQQNCGNSRNDRRRSSREGKSRRLGRGVEVEDFKSDCESDSHSSEDALREDVAWDCHRVIDVLNSVLVNYDFDNQVDGRTIDDSSQYFHSQSVSEAVVSWTLLTFLLS